MTSFSFGTSAFNTPAAPTFGATPAPTFGGFGATAPAAGSSIFGTTSTATAPPATGGFGFNAAAAPAPAAGTTTFSFAPAAAQPAPAGLFSNTTGLSGWGQSAAQPQQQLPQLLPPQTKFVDLPDQLKKQFLEFDNFLHQQSLIRDEIGAHSSPLDAVSPTILTNGTQAAPNALRTSIDSISTSISSLSLKLNQELLQLSNFESIVTEQWREGEHAQRNVNKILVGGGVAGGDNKGMQMLTPGQIRIGGNGSSLNERILLPSPYHWAKLQEFVTSIHALTTQVEVVEEYLHGQQVMQAQAQPNTLTNILHAQHTALVSVTGRVAAMHEQIDLVRDKFVAMYGREGEKRLTEERKKEMKKREAFDLNAPNHQPLVSSVPTTALPTGALQPVAAGTATAPASTTGFTFPGASPQPAAAPTTGFNGFSLPPATTPAAGTAPATGFPTFGGFGTTPAAAPATAPTTGFAGFGTTPAPATSAFGTPAATTPAPATGGFGGFTMPAAAGAAISGFAGFGVQPAATSAFGTPTAAPAGGFGSAFGAPPAAAPKLTRQNSTSSRRR